MASSSILWWLSATWVALALLAALAVDASSVNSWVLAAMLGTISVAWHTATSSLGCFARDASSRRVATTLTEATTVRMPETDDAADVARMDDHGGSGSQTGSEGVATPAVNLSGAHRSVPSGPIPGEREPGRLTQFGRPATSISRIVSDWPTMSAATIADRQREGGGAPSQRRPARERSRWKGARQRLHCLLKSTRARFRATHA